MSLFVCPFVIFFLGHSILYLSLSLVSLSSLGLLRSQTEPKLLRLVVSKVFFFIS